MCLLDFRCSDTTGCHKIVFGKSTYYNLNFGTLVVNKSKYKENYLFIYQFSFNF